MQDMDIMHFGNPLAFLWSALVDADMAISTEIWVGDHTFSGDACMTSGPGCTRRDQQRQPSTDALAEGLLGNTNSSTSSKRWGIKPVHTIRMYML